jgi:dolichyl-phosphate beta-glucosyltransferase
MLDYLDRKEFDVVVGTRNPSTTDLSSRPLARRVASGIYTAIVSRIVVTGVHDTQCGVKGFRAAAAESLFGDLQTTGFAFDVEILYRAFKADMDIKRVPVHLLASEGSTVSLLRHGPAMFWTVVALPFRYHFNRLRAAGRSGHKPEHEA